MTAGTASPPSDDIINCGWEGVIKGAAYPSCQEYSRRFFEELGAQPAALNPSRASALRLLGDITSMQLRRGRESLAEPFGPLSVGEDGRRTALPADLTDEQLDALQAFLPSVSDPELSARVGDLLWVRKRAFAAVQAALPAYLSSADRLAGLSRWPEVLTRVEGALRLSAQIGKTNGSFYQGTVDWITRFLDGAGDGHRRGALCRSMMRLLLEFGEGDAQKYALAAENEAKQREQERDWMTAEDFWEIAAAWNRRLGDSVKEHDLLVSAAETHAKAAQDALSGTEPRHAAAALHLERAVQAMRRLQEHQRAEQLHRELLNEQHLATSEMQRFTFEFDIEEAAKGARSHVRGRSFDEAILALAGVTRSPRVRDIENLADSLATEAPLQHLVEKVLINEAGRVVARRPSRFSQDPDEVAQAKRADMLELAAQHRRGLVQGLIEPARYQINLEHAKLPIDFGRVVNHNPFVPPGRQEIFARGMHAGLVGDFLIAGHLLIPQVEHSIRGVLGQAGGISSGLTDPLGIQEEQDLNFLLYRPEVAQILDGDLLFDLQGLFVERFGSNLRNALAHGLIAESAFYSLDMRYAWWLVWRLVCWPFLYPADSRRAVRPSETNDSASAKSQAEHSTMPKVPASSP